ncbi:hypothetical protein, partial [Luteimonas salinisoli]|uniref:hypothetical protein n=1 Tax=Luteimonas salinisoli TaxID=2752307 RepID=UPI001C5CA60D
MPANFRTRTRTRTRTRERERERASCDARGGAGTKMPAWERRKSRPRRAMQAVRIAIRKGGQLRGRAGAAP